MGNSSNFPDSVEFGRMAPGIRGSNIEKSVAFYTSILGMCKTFENGSPVGFVILKKEIIQKCGISSPAEKTLLKSVAYRRFSHTSISRKFFIWP